MAISENKKRISVTFEKALLERVLSKEAKESGKSISQIVAEIVEEYYQTAELFKVDSTLPD